MSQYRSVNPENEKYRTKKQLWFCGLVVLVKKRDWHYILQFLGQQRAI